MAQDVADGCNVWSVGTASHVDFLTGMHMMFKLDQYAEKNWRRLSGFDYLVKPAIGIQFKDGIEVTAINQAAA